jgi:hypothetical protein
MFRTPYHLPGLYSFGGRRCLAIPADAPGSRYLQPDPCKH